MKQFGTILSFELKYYFKNKVFVGITVFLVLAIAGVMFFPRIAALFISDDAGDTPDEESGVMLVSVDDPQRTDAVLQAFAAAFPGYRVEAFGGDPGAIGEQITSGAAQCAFVLTGPTSYTYYVDNLSMYDMNTETADEVLRRLYQLEVMVDGGMTVQQAGEVMNVHTDSRVESLGKNQIQNFFYTYIMIFALYMVILLYGQMVATNVATEKSSRAMEVLITSARPTSMMFGKVLASCLAGLIQLAAIFGSALLFYSLNQSYWGGNMIVDSFFNIPPGVLVYMLVFFVLGFLIYAFLFGAVGSTASKLEDINTSVMPITLLFVVAFLVVVFSMASGSVENPIMTVCSFIPFTSPMSMFTRIAMSTVPWYEIAISIAILVGSTVGIGVISAKIYRVGVLLYGTPPKLGAILKAVWRA